MDTSWISSLIPLLNASGLPILAVGIFILIRAYQKLVEAHKTSYEELLTENDRLRRRLASVDDSYFQEMEKLHSIIKKSSDAIDELQVRKITLLSSEQFKNDQERILSDIPKINKIIELLQEVLNISHDESKQFRDIHDNMKKTLEAVRLNIGLTACEISDIPSRLHSLKPIATDKIYNTIQEAVGKNITGLTYIEKSPEEELRLEEEKYKHHIRVLQHEHEMDIQNRRLRLELEKQQLEITKETLAIKNEIRQMEANLDYKEKLDELIIANDIEREKLILENKLKVLEQSLNSKSINSDIEGP